MITDDFLQNTKDVFVGISVKRHRIYKSLHLRLRQIKGIRQQQSSRMHTSMHCNDVKNFRSTILEERYEKECRYFYQVRKV